MREKVRHVRNLSTREMLTSDSKAEWSQGEENLAYEKEVWTENETVAVILSGLTIQTHCYNLSFYYISQYFFSFLRAFQKTLKFHFQLIKNHGMLFMLTT